MRRRARRRCAALVLVAALAAPAGCGGGSRGSAAEEPELTVAAAASLSGALERTARGFRPARVRLSLAGSDELAAQIRRGARPDVFAAADAELPRALAREGLAEAPTAFATNRLVLAVPAGSPIDSLADLEAPGRRLVVGTASVPVGRLTRAVLARLGPERSRRILAAVRSEEPDVRGVAAKVAGGAADAGFVYRTDVRAAGARLRALELPERLRPYTTYGAAVVRGAPEAGLARRFVADLRSGAGARALREAGFGSAPSRP
jgi:molybdate transport system substrate-binding protein